MNMSLFQKLESIKRFVRWHWWWLTPPLLFWYSFFVWNGPVYKYQPEPCYSPNREYYYMMYESLWSCIVSCLGYEFGTVEVYDKHHKLLFKTPSPFNAQGGPYWGEGGEKGDIFYVSVPDEWSFDLPGPAGEDTTNSPYLFPSCAP